MSTPTFDARSEKNLKTLLPEAEAQARVFLKAVLEAGITARIIGGTRTFAEQDELFAQGRTKPGKVVTNARGGFSNHNFGIAWDIGIFSGSTYLPESPLYDKAGPIGRDLGLEWGGDFKSFKDRPHYQCKTGLTLAQLRQLKKEGKPIPILSLRVPDPVAVFVNGELTDIPGLFISQRTWVGVRRAIEVLGGSLISAGGKPFRAVVRRGTEQRRLEGQIIGETGFVKFADLNELFELGFAFDSSQRRLNITRL